MADFVRVLVPATTANLGPGFDSLALTLDLWNEAVFTLSGEGIIVEVEGEGSGSLPAGGENLIARAMAVFFDQAGESAPAGLHIHCYNRIPLGSGLGSSAAAILTGLLAANALTNNPASPDDLLNLADQIEGHPDNVSAALLGGLVIVAGDTVPLVTRRVDIPPLQVAIVLPLVELPTHSARRVLPESVAHRDAVFNLSRTALVVEALRSGDLDLLAFATQDRLHQPYRLRLIPGAAEAMNAARDAGAAAVVLSGAGPSLIAFCASRPETTAQAMAQALQHASVPHRTLLLSTTNHGAAIETGTGNEH